jgi:hypothetical protein
MIVELTISWMDITTLVISILSLIILTIYTFFTYKIAYEKKSPLISFNLIKADEDIGHIGFNAVNSSHVDAEIWCKVHVLAGGKIFLDNSFYGNKTPWNMQSLMKYYGHFRLGNMENQEGMKLNEFIKNKDITTVKLSIQIRYRIIGGRKWIKSPIQRYAYNFDKNLFWLDV